MLICLERDEHWELFYFWKETLHRLVFQNGGAELVGVDSFRAEPSEIVKENRIIFKINLNQMTCYLFFFLKKGQLFLDT